MNRNRLLPSLPLAALMAAAALACAPIQAQTFGLDAYVTTTFHYVDGNGQHHPGNVCSSASGTCTSAMPYAQAQGTVRYGTADGSTSVSSIGRDGAGSGLVDLHWWDTFTITSATLPIGTPVTVHMEVDMAAAVVPSLAAPDRYTRAQAGLTYGGPDGTGLVFAGTGSGFSLHSAANLTQVVGQTFTLWGNLLMFTDTSWGIAPDRGSVVANAVWHIDVLEADAAYSTTSGLNYVSGVPEAPQALAFLSGLLLLAWRARDRRHG